jgi:aryl-alcohol dehydrogenase-like predicted oxidoreductase
MRYRTLGRTGIRVSEVAFGAGPVSGLWTGDDHAAQVAALRRALELGINWIDTAAGYGNGMSEENLGRALREIDATGIHLATKVRLTPDQFGDIRGAVRRSVEESLRRLGVPSVTLLQLHNGLTTRRDDEPFSITPEDVLGERGVLDAFRETQAAGLVRYLGLTGTGQPAGMREVVRSGGFDTIQVPYHLLNPSAGRTMPAGFGETDYGDIIADGADMNLGVFAIRVFAGGALLDREPSAHTYMTPFFPMPLYERDREKARAMAGTSGSLKERAVRFVLDDSRVHSAIVGFGDANEVGELVGIVGREADRET